MTGTDLRVLLLLVAGDIPGGHVVQATKTATALAAAGVDVTLTEDAGAANLDGYHVVHTFGAHADIGRRARAAGAAVAISPIWWSADYTTGTAALSARKRLERGLRLSYSAVRRGIVETAQRVREPIFRNALVFEFADALLPNSQLEGDQIRRDLRVSTPMCVVPNAIDESEFLSAAPDARRSRLRRSP